MNSDKARSEIKHHDHDSYIDTDTFIIIVRTKNFSKTLNGI